MLTILILHREDSEAEERCRHVAQSIWRKAIFHSASLPRSYYKRDDHLYSAFFKSYDDEWAEIAPRCYVLFYFLSLC